jgi:hypothetical protein
VPARTYRRLVHPLLVRAHRRRRRFLRATAAYLPYFAMRVHLDDARARAALGPQLAPAPLHGYFDRLVDYALLTDWGRRPLTRAEMQARTRETAPRPAATSRAGSRLRDPAYATGAR